MFDENLFATIYSYCENHSNIEAEILSDLYRETHLKTLAPRMISGPIQGRLLSLLCSLLQPSLILEIGTFTGYATLCMSEGLSYNGEIHTIEVNPEFDTISDKYFRRAGMRNKIISHIGNAKEVIATMEKFFDFVFIDAKKMDYSKYFDLIIDKVNPGGLILADNALWDGKVFNNGTDPTTIALQAFNQKVKDDDRVSTILLPLRDGLTIMKKIK